MKLASPAGLAAGLIASGLLAATPALAAGPANVQVRVEGDGATLVPQAAVRTTTAPVARGADSCSGTSALGALDAATGGDWSGPYYAGLGFQPETIRGETHDAATSTYWTFWLNDRYSLTGLCDAELQEGDRVLLFPDCYAPGCTSPTPLRLSGVPARVAPGRPAKVRVDELVVDPSTFETSARPAAGATVTGGAAPATTGADGTATISFSARGPHVVQATEPGHVRSATAPVCVTDGTDGACGTSLPGGSPTPSAAPDRDDPVVRVRSPRAGHRYARRHAPRTLRGAVAPDPSGIADVRIRLKRRAAHRRCAVYDPRRERFAPRSCYRNGRWFSVGDRQAWSYLLPARLAPGRYTLDVRAIDGAGNRSRKLRVRFAVR